MVERKPKITLEDLATMVARGFAEVHEKMDKGFANVDERFIGVNKRLDNHEERFDGIEMRLDDIEGQLSRIEKKQDAQQTMLDSHDRRITKIEKVTGVKP